MTLPLLTLACLCPLACAALVRRVPDPERARTAALWGALTTLAALASAAIQLYARGAASLVEPSITIVGSRIHYQMGIDPLSAPLLLLVGCIVVAMLLAGPRRELSSDAIASLLVTEAFSLGMFATRDLVVFAVCWIAALVPMNLWTRRHLPSRNAARRVFLGMSIVCSVPLAAAVVWLGFVDRTQRPGAFDMLELHTHGVPLSVQAPVFVLVALAALARMGVPPFHSWLPKIWAGAPLHVSLLAVTSPAGVYLLSRFGLPLFSQPASGRVPLIADLALVGALYGAVLAFGQKDLQRMLGGLAISQSGLMLIGLASTNAQGETAALLLCIGDRVALCGLLLTVWIVQARAGTTEIARLGGLMATMPRAAAAFLLFALASIGAPGTLGFVAEDLLIGGIIRAYPWIAAVVVLTTVLNGVTMARAFSRVFLGPAPDPRVERALLPDLSRSERWVSAALIAFLVVAGVAPDLLTHTVYRATAEMRTLDASHGDSAGPPHR